MGGIGWGVPGQQPPPQKQPETKGVLEVEVEFDPEVTRVRKWRQEQLERAGFTYFPAFRLSMIDDWRTAIRYLEKGATEDWVLDQLLD